MVVLDNIYGWLMLAVAIIAGVVIGTAYIVGWVLGTLRLIKEKLRP